MASRLVLLAICAALASPALAAGKDPASEPGKTYITCLRATSNEFAEGTCRDPDQIISAAKGVCEDYLREFAAALRTTRSYRRTMDMVEILHSQMRDELTARILKTQMDSGRCQ